MACGRNGRDGGLFVILFREQPLDLREVIEVVTGVQAQQVAHALLAALRMHPEPIERLVVERLEERDQRRADRSEQRERRKRVAILVVQRACPSVLVERLDGRAGADRIIRIR